MLKYISRFLLASNFLCVFLNLAIYMNEDNEFNLAIAFINILAVTLLWGLED